jgi:hypothetical protein
MNDLIPTAYFDPKHPTPEELEGCMEGNIADKFRAVDPNGSRAMELLRSFGKLKCDFNIKLALKVYRVNL